MNQSVIILISTLVLGYVVQATANEEEFLISNESFLNLEDGGLYRHLVERAASSSRLSAAEIADFLNKHNELRGQTVPRAANMRHMVWDASLATMAQQWSDGCKWAHGNPKNISPYPSIGQNLFMSGYGSRSKPVNGKDVVQSWFNEDHFYTYSTGECQDKKVCGHYTQVVWAKSYAVGCGMTFCPITTGDVTWENAWVVTCNYGPAGNGGGKPFLEGTPCTKCDSGIGECYANQCRLCSTHSEPCVCAQVCLNGGVLDSDKCSCTCPDGFYGTDCSKPCKDTHKNCGANPGWPKSWCDAAHPYVLSDCPALCGLCKELCTKVCQHGGVLNEEKCTCTCTIGYTGEVCDEPCKDTNRNCGANPGWPKSWCDAAHPYVLSDCPAMCGLCKERCTKVCQHGGVLNEENCTCRCTTGYIGEVCDEQCQDKHRLCGANPGWPKRWCDDAHSYVLTNCPLMCGLCTPLAY